MQNAQSERLVNCFKRVFPSLSPDAIPVATHDTVAGWDSIAQITLLSLISEEFGMVIDFEEFEGATSFAGILELLRTRAGHA